jgi:hypothetical protein
VALDDISIDSEMTGQRTSGPSSIPKFLKKFVVFGSQLGTDASPLIHRLGHWFNVLRVDTQPDPAQMVRLQTFWPRAYALHPYSAMSNGSSALHTHLSVATLTDRCSSPNPARGAVAPIFNPEVALVYQSVAHHPTSASYTVMQVRASLDGYPENLVIV